MQVIPLHWQSGKLPVQPRPGPPPLPAPAARNACQFSIAAAKAKQASTAEGAYTACLHVRNVK